MMMNFLSTVIIFQEERPVFLREYAEKLYRISPYFTSKLITEIPIMIIDALLLAFITYFGVGLTETFIKFLKFIFVLILVAFTGTAFGYFISSMF